MSSLPSSGLALRTLITAAEGLKVFLEETPVVAPVEGDSPLPAVCGTKVGSALMMARSSGAIFVASALRR